MIVRIVKMRFHPELEQDFLGVFHQSAEKIREFEGCLKMNLFKVKTEELIFMTISHWNSENDLENYRNSELFKNTWKAVKALFSGAPEAWTLEMQALRGFQETLLVS